MRNESTKALTDSIGLALFDQFLAARTKKTTGPRDAEGRIHSKDNPGWLNCAIVLAEYFAPVDAWAFNNSIIALTHTSLNDLASAIEAENERETPDKDRVAALDDIAKTLESFLTRNGLTVGT